MKIGSIEDITSIYGHAETVSMQWRSIKLPELKGFSLGVERLVNAVGDLDQDTHWGKFMRRLRQFRFSCMATAYSKNFFAQNLDAILADLSRNENMFGLSYPDARPAYQTLKFYASRLRGVDLAQILSEIVKDYTVNEKKRTLVLVCQTRYVSDSEQALNDAGLSNWSVTSPAYLRDDIAFEQMLVIGPTRWFPEYVFTAPRANNIHVIKYSWIRDSWKHKTAFLSPMKSKAGRILQMVSDDDLSHDLVDADVLLPPEFNLQSIRNKVTDEIKGHSEIDYVQARPVLLEDDWVVLLESDDASSILVIDLHDHESPVKKNKMNEIVPGVFVLLRSGGGGDFIVPVADGIMGKEGIRARACQKRWKELLRDQVLQYGYDKVVNTLTKHGSTRANPVNLRNWMSVRSIKTEFRNDFDAIMATVGLEQDCATNWELMEIIDRAHRRAGHTIRNMLLEKVKTSDLSSLKRTGKMVFELDADAQISITAFQVKKVLDETMPVLPWRIGIPMPQTDDE